MCGKRGSGGGRGQGCGWGEVGRGKAWKGDGVIGVGEGDRGGVVV